MASVEEVCDEIALINHSQVVLSGDVHSIKERFRTGVYEVTSRDATLRNTPNIFTINAHTQHAGLHHYTLSKTADADNSQLFAAVAAQISPRSISEQMPTMQEIFYRPFNPPHLPSIMNKFLLVVQREFMTRVKKSLSSFSPYSCPSYSQHWYLCQFGWQASRTTIKRPWPWPTNGQICGTLQGRPNLPFRTHSQCRRPRAICRHHQLRGGG